MAQYSQSPSWGGISSLNSDPSFTGNADRNSGTAPVSASPSNVYGDPDDYFRAVVGTIRAANSELDDLLKVLDATTKRGAS